MSKYCMTENNNVCDCDCSKYKIIRKRIEVPGTKGYMDDVCKNCGHRQNQLDRWSNIIMRGDTDAR